LKKIVLNIKRLIISPQRKYFRCLGAMRQHDTVVVEQSCESSSRLMSCRRYVEHHLFSCITKITSSGVLSFTSRISNLSHFLNEDSAYWQLTTTRRDGETTSDGRFGVLPRPATDDTRGCSVGLSMIVLTTNIQQV
jgi:hypothetical protein